MSSSVTTTGTEVSVYSIAYHGDPWAILQETEFERANYHRTGSKDIISYTPPSEGQKLVIDIVGSHTGTSELTVSYFMAAFKVIIVKVKDGVEEEDEVGSWQYTGASTKESPVSFSFSPSYLLTDKSVTYKVRLWIDTSKNTGTSSSIRVDTLRITVL